MQINISKDYVCFSQISLMNMQNTRPKLEHLEYRADYLTSLTLKLQNNLYKFVEI